MNKFFRTKIRIPRPYNARELYALQSALFNMGFEWTSEGNKYRDEPEMFGIFINDFGKLTWTRYKEDFESHPYYEISFSLSVYANLIEPDRKSITVEGVTYDATEFQQAIKDLKPVSY